MARASKPKKAKKAAPAKARIKKRAKAGIQAVAPDSGPVTLAEAKAFGAGETADAGRAGR